MSNPAIVEHLPCLLKLLHGVHPSYLPGILRLNSANRKIVPPEIAEHIRQVVLFLCVLRGNMLQPLKQGLPVEDVNP